MQDQKKNKKKQNHEFMTESSTASSASESSEEEMDDDLPDIHEVLEDKTENQNKPTEKSFPDDRFDDTYLLPQRALFGDNEKVCIYPDPVLLQSMQDHGFPNLNYSRVNEMNTIWQSDIGILFQTRGYASGKILTVFLHSKTAS